MPIGGCVPGFWRWASSFATLTGLTVITLSQEEVAGLAGASRATVSRVLAEEQRRGTLVKAPADDRVAGPRRPGAVGRMA
jgi:CRP-like cAMP-binding protein